MQHEKSAIWKECIMKKVYTKQMQQKSETWMQYKKQKNKRDCNMERLKHKRLEHEESESWKKRNTKIVQHGKSATWTKYSDRAKFGKKCKRRLYYSAQTDSEQSVNRPLYAGYKVWPY